MKRGDIWRDEDEFVEILRVEGNEIDYGYIKTFVIHSTIDEFKNKYKPLILEVGQIWKERKGNIKIKIDYIKDNLIRYVWGGSGSDYRYMSYNCESIRAFISEFTEIEPKILGSKCIKCGIYNEYMIEEYTCWGCSNGY